MPYGKTISVAMCTYNGEKYIGEQLASIAAQSRLPAQLVIFDDQSKDSTVEIIEAFARKAPFEVSLQVNPVNIGSSSKGITKNFEQATRLCTGDLIAPCDQDDIWVPHKLARMAEILENDASVGAVFSDAQLVTETGVPKGILMSQTTGLTVQEQRRLARGDSLPIVLAMTKAYGCSLMFHVRLREKILPVPEHWWYDAWVTCMAAVHSKLVFTPEELFFYRIHPMQSGSAWLDTLPQKVQRWRRSAADYWRDSEPQLRELHERLQADGDARLDPSLRYIEGRMKLLRFRSELPANRFVRAVKIVPAMGNYHRFFNGWRSIAKDLTA